MWATNDIEMFMAHDGMSACLSRAIKEGVSRVDSASFLFLSIAISHIFLIPVSLHAIRECFFFSSQLKLSCDVTRSSVSGEKKGETKSVLNFGHSENMPRMLTAYSGHRKRKTSKNIILCDILV